MVENELRDRCVTKCGTNTDDKYGCACCTIFHFIEKGAFLFFNCQIYLLSSVWFFLHLLLKLDLWFTYLDLKVSEVMPMYVYIDEGETYSI